MRFAVSVLISLAVTIAGLLWAMSWLNPGMYNAQFEIIKCDNREACLHEVGHKTDHHLGWVSRTEKFHHDIDVYRLGIWEYPQFRDEMSLKFNTFPGLGSIYIKSYNPLESTYWSQGWGGYSELYASIVSWYDGKKERCPAALRDYYDWDFIGAEMEKLGYGR